MSLDILKVSLIVGGGGLATFLGACLTHHLIQGSVLSATAAAIGGIALFTLANMGIVILFAAMGAVVYCALIDRIKAIDFFKPFAVSIIPATLFVIALLAGSILLNGGAIAPVFQLLVL